MKKLLAILVAILMVVTMLPMAVLPAGAMSETQDGFIVHVTYGVCKYCGDQHGIDSMDIKSISVKNGKVTFQLSVSFKSRGDCSKPVNVKSYTGANTSVYTFAYTITDDFSCEKSYLINESYGQNFGEDKPKLLYSISREEGHQASSWAFNGTKHSGTCELCGKKVNDNCSGGTATCMEKATCSTCGNKYGSLASDNHDWSNLDGICANGCGAECDHTWGEGALVRPTKTKEGYYTYTCSACGATKTEAVQRAANYAEYTEALNDIRAYLDSDKLTDDVKASVAEWLELYDSDAAYKFIAGEEETVNLYIEAALYYATEIETAIQDCLAGNHSGNGEYCDICGASLHICDFSGEWKYDSEKHWKECTCGEIDGEAEHTFTEGKCACGYECPHANYADGACDNCDVKQKYTVRMETKLSEGVEFVGNPVAIHGEDLIIEFKNLVSEKCNDVSLFELTIGANSFYEFEFDENGITFDGTVLTIPGELVNGDVETHANAYTQARIKLNGGKFSPECPPDIVEEYFIENDYAISNKMLVGYTNSVKDTFVKDKHTIKSILASDGNDYNKIYYFSPNSDLEMTIEWECLPENFENGVCVECGYECSHEKYTDGVCDVCGYKCPHEWVGVAFAKPTRTEEGYYTYTCSVCKSTKTEPVERPANYAEFKELIEKVKDYLDENLTDSMMQEVNNVINFFELDENHGFIKGEENTVSQMIRQISEFVEVVEEGIADGTALRVDGFTVYNERGREWLLKFADEGVFEKARELILNSTEVKAKMDEIYDFALSLEGNVAENAENIAKIEADVDEFFGQLKKCVYGIHNVSQYKEISPAKCGENAIESAVCTLCGETVTREVENSALKHSFTKYEETEAPKCGVEGKEVAVCDNGCGETDEKAIEALTHTDADGDYICDYGCGHEFEKPAPEEPTDDDEICTDCGGSAHPDTGLPQYLCMIITFMKLIFSLVRVLQSI